MNRFLLACLLFISSQALIIAQGSSLFRINIGTFVGAKNSDFANLADLGLLYARQMDGTMQQVYLGGYSERKAAETALTKVRSAGYSGAFIQESFPSEGSTVTVIQIATLPDAKDIDWSRYSDLGDIYAIFSNNKIKIATGIYANLDEARAAVKQIRKNKRFSDAFIKNLNSIYLHKIGAFETGIFKKEPLIPIKLEENTPITKRPDAYNESTRTSYPKSGTVPAQPRAYSDPSTVRTTTAKSGSNSLPTIRPDVKRRSALELQKALKAQGTYRGSLDGYYGPGTSEAYQAAIQQQPQYRKYALVARYAGSSSNQTGDALQQAINQLPFDGGASATIDSYSSPVAKAYRAYQLYNTLGASNEVNMLMNDALRTSFQGKSLQGFPPFDARATYAYNDLTQLIQHLYYIHASPGQTYALPCWLSQQHPREAALAMSAFNGYSAAPNMEACDQFSQWEEIKILQSMAEDFGGGTSISPEERTQAASVRSRMYLATQGLSPALKQDAEQWNQALWENINKWAAKDIVHKQMVDGLKLAYFQAQVRLEDFYMNKGFSSDDAKGLALATLRTFVEADLKRFS